MKNRVYLFVVLLLLSGCKTYVIDSKPQGLRVEINHVDIGITPVEYQTSIIDDDSFDIEVEAPTTAQIKMYENRSRNSKVVRKWASRNKTKIIRSDKASGGTIFFNFITDEDFNENIQATDENVSKKVMTNDKGWKIVSNPSGLRVTVNNIDVGATPLHYEPKSSASFFVIQVDPPMKQDLKRYEEENKKIVSTWYTATQQKNIMPGLSEYGTISFQFIASEYDVPTTEEEREWVAEQCKQDIENLEKEKKLRIELENK